MEHLDSTIQRLHDPDYRARCRAIQALRRRTDPRALDALLAALGDRAAGDTDRRVNTHAALALAGMGETAIGPLVSALEKDPTHPDDSWRRYWVTRSLALIHDQRVVPPLIAAIADPDPLVVEGATEALARLEQVIGLHAERTAALARLKARHHELRAGPHTFLLGLLQRTISQLDAVPESPS